MLPPGEKSEPTDWGEAFTTLLCHTNLSYEEICRRTIPQLEAILSRLNKHISLKLGVPMQSVSVDTAKEHTIEDGMAIAAMFNNLF